MAVRTGFGVNRSIFLGRRTCSTQTGVQSTPKILVTAGYLLGKELPYIRWLRERGVAVDFLPRSPQQMSAEERLTALAPYQVAIIGVEPYTAEFLALCPQLKGLARAGVGMDSVDLEAAKAAGIEIRNVPGGNTDAVAEHTLALILAVQRRLLPMHALVCSGGWTREPVSTLRGKTVGLFGYGAIAQRLAEMLSPLGAQVIYCARSKPSASFSELLAQADILSLHAPLTPETKARFNLDAFTQMKSSAVLVNTARAGLVVTADLVHALKQGLIAAAAIDVFEEEPLRDNPFAGLSNVLLSPHLAGVDEATIVSLSQAAAENALAMLTRENVIARA